MIYKEKSPYLDPCVRVCVCKRLWQLRFGSPFFLTITFSNFSIVDLISFKVSNLAPPPLSTCPLFSWHQRLHDEFFVHLWKQKLAKLNKGTDFRFARLYCPLLLTYFFDSLALQVRKEYFGVPFDAPTFACNTLWRTSHSRPLFNSWSAVDYVTVKGTYELGELTHLAHFAGWLSMELQVD